MKEILGEYERKLEQAERSQATRQQYLRNIRQFLIFAGNKPLRKELVIDWKETLQKMMREMDKLYEF